MQRTRKISRLKLIRLERGMTIQEFADDIGVARTTLQSYESGRREFSMSDKTTAKRIAHALGMSQEELGEAVQPTIEARRMYRKGSRHYDKMTRLKQIRLEKDITQEEMAGMIGVSKSQLQGFENGRYDIALSQGATANLISLYFGKTQAELGEWVDVPATINDNLSIHKRGGIKPQHQDCYLCGIAVDVHPSCRSCTALVHPTNDNYKCRKFDCLEVHGVDSGHEEFIFCTWCIENGKVTI